MICIKMLYKTHKDVCKNHYVPLEYESGREVNCFAACRVENRTQQSNYATMGDGHKVPDGRGCSRLSRVWIASM